MSSVCNSYVTERLVVNSGLTNGTNNNHTPNAVETASCGNLTIAGLTNKNTKKSWSFQDKVVPLHPARAFFGFV